MPCEAVEKKGEQARWSLCSEVSESLVSYFPSFSTVYLQKCVILMRRNSRGFDQSLASVLDWIVQSNELNYCWLYVSRPRRQGPTEQWWTLGQQPPPAGVWCHQSHCWWWSGQSSERRSVAASLILSGVVEESHPDWGRTESIHWLVFVYEFIFKGQEILLCRFSVCWLKYIL